MKNLRHVVPTSVVFHLRCRLKESTPSLPFSFSDLQQTVHRHLQYPNLKLTSNQQNETHRNMKRTSSLYLLFVFLSHVLITKLTTATVFLKPFSISYPDLPAKFSLPLNSSGLCGTLYVADPLSACSPLHNRVELNGSSSSIALVVRGECAFEDKVRNVQDSGFQAVVVFDDKYRRNLIYMMMNPDGVKVHAVFVSKAAGEVLMAYARRDYSECCIVPSHFDAAWTVLAISFLSLILILAFITIAFLVPRHWLHWRRLDVSRRSMDGRDRMVDELPKFTFCSLRLDHCQTQDTCAICLEDYKEGEVLKLLPCKHEFHSTCVDSWLTKWGTFCPVCKLEMKS